MFNFLYFYKWRFHLARMNTTKKIMIFYDGDCPLCCAKRDFLKRRDHKQVLTFSDIRSPNFKLPFAGISIEKLAFEIHSINEEGEMLRGMDVIREAYRAVGLGWLISPTTWPIIRPVFDKFYTWIAANRMRISNIYRSSKD